MSKYPEYGDKVRIVRQLKGDDTPIGTTGTVQYVGPGICGLIIRLDESPDEAYDYHTSVDGNDWEFVGEEAKA